MKKQLMLGAAMLVALGVSAQNPAETEIKETIVTEKVPSGSVFSGARDNWFVSAGAGPQVFFGDHDRQRKFGQRISPAP